MPLITEYRVIPTISGFSTGSIFVDDVSGGTKPYTISWSPGNQTTFDIKNLSVGSYTATVVDSLSVSGQNVIDVSAYTRPVFSASVTSNLCVDNTNNFCKYKVFSAGTEGGELPEPNLRYRLFKNGNEISDELSFSGNSFEKEYDNLTTGKYTFTVERPVNFIKEYNVLESTCTGVTNFSKISGDTNYVDFSTITSLYEDDLLYSPAFIEVGGIVYTTGFYEGGVYSDSSNNWFFTGNVRTGELNYPFSNPNTARTTDNSKFYYLGVTGSSLMGEGYNWGPTGGAFGGGFPALSEIAYDLTGGTISPSTHDGYFYYNPYIDKFVVYRGTPSNGIWVTVDSTTPILSGLSLYTIGGILGGAVVNTRAMVDYVSGTVVRQSDIDPNYVSLFMQMTDSLPITTNYLSKCKFLDYTHDITVRTLSGGTINFGVILASIVDTNGRYGDKDFRHDLSLEFYQKISPSESYSRVVYNKYNQSSHSFQRELYPKNVEYSSIVLQNLDRSFSGSSTPVSPFVSTSTLGSQGAVRILITRSGELGENFNIQMSDTMAFSGDTTVLDSVKTSGDLNPFNPNYEINFNLRDISTWTGTSQSTPSWVKPNSLDMFLGGVSNGYYASKTFEFTTGATTTQFYQLGLTGTPGNFSVDQSEETNPIFTTTSFDLFSSDTLIDVVDSQSCYFNPVCQNTLPIVKPNLTASLQTLSEPTLVIEGLSKLTDEITKYSIYNSSLSGGSEIQVNVSGNTTNLSQGGSYLKLDVYPYQSQKERYSVIPDYRYLFDKMVEIDDPLVIKLGGGLSASTFVPFSAFSTGSSHQFLVKPSYLVKDKSGNGDIFIDTDTVIDVVEYDNQKDYLLTIVSPPSTPSLTNNDLNFPANGECRMESDYFIVAGVPDFSGSDFTYSGVTLPFETKSDILVMVNGVVMNRASGDNLSPGNTAFTPSGDYRILYSNPTIIVFRPQSVKNGDVIQVMYPTDNKRSYYKQSVTVGTPGTSSGSTIYQNGTYYFINLEYPALGSVAMVYNGQILIENIDYQKVGSNLIQILSVLYNDLQSSDTFTLYYLTQFLVSGRSSTKEPNTLVSFNKTIGYRESLKQVVYDMTSGEVVQELEKTYSVSDFGSKQEIFTIVTPNFGHYKYKVIATRYYKLLGGKGIETNVETQTVIFDIPRNIFFSPYRLPNQRNNSLGGPS